METNSEQRPSAALINREWLEAASSVLSRDDLAKAVLCAVEYVLYGQVKQSPGGSLSVVFAMVRPALDSDIAKYRERCARNAANARAGRERAGASGSESQRVGANTTTTPTTTTTTTPCLSSTEEDQKREQREKWLVYGYFWSIGSKAIKEELLAFWSYYEALGWKNNKGAVIVSKLAAARMWRRQFETGSVPVGAVEWFRILQTCPVPDVNLWLGYRGGEIKDDVAIIRTSFGADFLRQLREVLPQLEKSLQKAWGVARIEFQTK